MTRFRLWYHVLFWTLLLSVAVGYDTVSKSHRLLTWGRFFTELRQPDTLVETGRVMFTVYFSLWVFTRLAAWRQLPLVLGQIVVLGFLDAALTYCLQRYVVPQFNVVPDPEPISSITAKLPFSWLFVMLAFVFKQLRDQRQHEALRHERNDMELAYLRAQLNPHFLLNSMNNLYGLALTEPERSADAILRLAELMRYMLYESSAERVPLTQEVEYLRNYVALETLRHEGAVYIDFVVEGPLAGAYIAPLLLICFVENAFKHGTVSNPAQPVQLHLAVHENQLSFATRNQIVDQNKDLAGGVGLPTVRRRLALLYPRRHRLAITQDAGSFCCLLELAIGPVAGPAPARS